MSRRSSCSATIVSNMPLTHPLNSHCGIPHGFNTRSNAERGPQSALEMAISTRQPSITLAPIHSLNLDNWASSPVDEPTPRCGNSAMTKGPLGHRFSSEIDLQMMNPTSLASSPIPNHMNNTQLSPQSDHTKGARTCVCSMVKDPPASGSPTIFNQDPFHTTQPHVQLPVDDLLDGSSPIKNAPDTQWNIWPEQSALASNTKDQGQHFSSTHWSSFSTISTTMSCTSQAPLSTAKEHDFLLSTLYHICVDATTSYIYSLIPASRSRYHQPDRHRHYHPYISAGHGPASYSTSSNRSRPASLMNNISTICTYLWRKARHDDMAPHCAEAEAVRNMRDLYVWAELVARGPSSDGLLSPNDLDLESEANYGDLGGEMNMAVRVGKAAMRICEWVDDGEAWDSCQSVVDELRDLVENDQGGRIVEVDNITEDGVNML